MSDNEQAPRCAKCGNAPAGPGGIICPTCKATIEAQRLPR